MVVVVVVWGAGVPELAWSFEKSLASCPGLNEGPRGDAEACSSTIAAVLVAEVKRLATRMSSRASSDTLRGRMMSSFLGSLFDESMLAGISAGLTRRIHHEGCGQKGARHLISPCSSSSDKHHLWTGIQ